MAIAVQGITNGYGATLGAGETRYYAVPTGMAITMTAFGTDAVFRSTLAGQPSVENGTATWSYAFGTPSNPLTAPQTRTALQPLILEVTAGIAGVTFTTSQGTPQAVWAEEIVADSGTISGILTVGGEVLTTETVETLTITTGNATHDVQLTNDATDTLILSSTADGQGACKVQAGAITCTSLDAGTGAVLGSSVQGCATVSVQSGNVTLTAGQAAYAALKFTGTPGAPRVVDMAAPAAPRQYAVQNDSDDAVTLKVTGQTGVAVATGKTATLWFDGTDIVVADAYLGAITCTALDAGSGLIQTTGAVRAYSANLGNDGGDPCCTVDTDGNLIAQSLKTRGLGPLFSAEGTTIAVGNNSGSTVIAEYGGTGSTQMANIAAATDLATAITLLNGFRTYFIARGTMAT